MSVLIHSQRLVGELFSEDIYSENSISRECEKVAIPYLPTIHIDMSDTYGLRGPWAQTVKLMFYSSHCAMSIPHKLIVWNG